MLFFDISIFITIQLNKKYIQIFLQKHFTVKNKKTQLNQAEYQPFIMAIDCNAHEALIKPLTCFFSSLTLDIGFIFHVQEFQFG